MSSFDMKQTCIRKLAFNKMAKSESIQFIMDKLDMWMLKGLITIKNGDGNKVKK